MRLIVARCSVEYSGRLSAHLPEALRLIIVKADGSVLVHADAGGYKPLNWMTPPTAVIEHGDTIIVRKVKGEDQLEITLHEVVSDVTHAMDFDADRLSKDGVEADLQVALAAHLSGDVGIEVSACEQATQLAPESAAAWSRLAHALAKTDRVSDCLAACEKALELADDPEVRNLREYVLARAPLELTEAA